MKTILVILIASLFIYHSLGAQNKPEDISESFLKRLKLSSKDFALADIYEHINSSYKTQIKKLIRDQIEKIDSMDKLNDWLWIADMELTKDLILKSYLLKYDQNPYRLDILFYKKLNIWCIQDASIDNQLFLDLKIAGRAEKIKPNNLVITY